MPPADDTFPPSHILITAIKAGLAVCKAYDMERSKYEDIFEAGWVLIVVDGTSQSKHTRSILIPRSVAVNVEAEAEYISRRRNEVSSVVNKHWAWSAVAAWPGARAHPLTGILFRRQASCVN
ncbi:hypothetical protein ACJJTC_009866 [Scirpophaga incertulas]